MEIVKKTSDYTVYQKRSGRYAVRGGDKKWINGDDKVNILLKEKLLKVTPPKPKKQGKKKEEAQAAEESSPAEDEQKGEGPAA